MIFSNFIFPFQYIPYSVVQYLYYIGHRFAYFSIYPIAYWRQLFVKRNLAYSNYLTFIKQC